MDCSKHHLALHLMRTNPELWFRGQTIEDRDRVLLTADPVWFVEYTQRSYLRKLYHMKAGQPFGMTDWTVENDLKCKKMVGQAGGALVGYNMNTESSIDWASMTVNVSIAVPHDVGMDTTWGFLSTRPSKTRIFKGPPETCPFHAWDAMILRDCTTNTDSLTVVESIASRKWDILLMKMCEDYDSPWIVMAVKDAGSSAEMLAAQTCFMT
ncbi:hypothetical protein F4778DRAFT_793299 [Xylariomycetidae sp. FL2044]|nr:hypothetical protein F4778DRAFT_793299 [Xylariomycetidae sp. FL2044]